MLPKEYYNERKRYLANPPLRVRSGQTKTITGDLHAYKKVEHMLVKKIK